MVKKSSFWVTVIMALALILTAMPALGTVKDGDKLGDLDFPAPISPEDANYLGVAADKPFKLSQVKAPYVLIEAFATSCAHCYQQAVEMNKLYNLIGQDSKLNGKIKIVGVGGGDNQFGLTMWKKQLKVPFPLLPDTDTKTTRKLNILGTPTTILLDKNGNVLKAHTGAFESAEAFLKELSAKVK